MLLKSLPKLTGWIAPILDWCTDDDISYEEKQKHGSGKDEVAPAIGQSTPAEQ